MVRDEYLFEAFRLCLRHKMSSPSAVKYLTGFEEDLIRLCDEINGRTYYPSTSTAFIVTKPKYREVFAACFRDRIVHHYIAMRIEPLFEQMFSPRTFNCRKEKGVLYGVEQLKQDVFDCSEGYTRDCWIARLDLQGFFMSIDKQLLDGMLQKFIADSYFGDDKEDIMWLSHIIMLHEPEKDCILRSPVEQWNHLPRNKSLFTNGEGLGLPIGNLPSQHNANFLLHGLDMALERLGFKYHGRYVDDFYYLDTDKQKMLEAVPVIRRYLKICLRITLHPDKFYFQHYTKGVKFIGAVIMPGRSYSGSRTIGNLHSAIWKLNKCHTRIQIEHAVQSVNSYLGQLRHFNAYHIRRRELSQIRPDLWDWIYIKGRFESIRMRVMPKARPVPKEEWPKVYYAKDPIDLSVLQETADHPN